MKTAPDRTEFLRRGWDDHRPAGRVFFFRLSRWAPLRGALPQSRRGRRGRVDWNVHQQRSASPRRGVNPYRSTAKSGALAHVSQAHAGNAGVPMRGCVETLAVVLDRDLNARERANQIDL